jgi:nucleoside-diphosphate-sugar epimerase
MMRVALVGANGFIGSRAVEILHLNGLAEVRPVVRTVASLARLARFDLEGCVADAFDQTALRYAFAGCAVVVHAVAGDPGVILGTLAPVYQAAQAAGVRRLVYLSTASVHGQAPALGTNEESPLSEDQPLAYNQAKVQAERELLKLRAQGTVEVVLLRPGIVWGPRSVWIANFADALLAGEAYLIDRGQGICNSIYVDNLVHAIYLALDAPGVDGEALLVGDREQVTWADLYRPLAEALGYNLTQLPEAVIPDFAPGWQERVKKLHGTKPVQGFLALFPQRWRQAAFDGLTTLLAEPSSPWTVPKPSQPVASQEMALLYRCQYKLPFDKARTKLGYEPGVSFAEGCCRTVGWLGFAGYPLVEREKEHGIRDSETVG